MGVSEVLLCPVISFFFGVCYNNCDNGISFKSVFYRKSGAIHSVDLVSLSGLYYILVCISLLLLVCVSVILFLVYTVCSLSVVLLDFANKDVH